MKNYVNSCLDILTLTLKVNLNASIIFLLIVSILSLADSQLFFSDDSELYGPLAGNFRIMLLYLSLTVMAVYGLSNGGEKVQALLALGIFLLAMAAGLAFYGQINQVPVDEHYFWLFGYCGLSQLGFASMRLYRYQG